MQVRSLSRSLSLKKGKNIIMKVGNKVKAKHTGLEGVVTFIKPYDPKSPVELHGTIVVKITKVGEEGYFQHYQWRQDFEIIR